MRKSNKGFSLVELIIVIAIMAVLIAVLAPQYIQYVEKTKVQADNTAVSEVFKATETAIADPQNKVTGQAVATVGTDGKISVTGSSKIQADVINVVGKSKIDLKSKKFTATDSTCTFNVDTNGNWTKAYTGPFKDVNSL